MRLNTKAKTIDQLSKYKSFNIAKHYFFSIKDYNKNKNLILKKFNKNLKIPKLLLDPQQWLRIVKR